MFHREQKRQRKENRAAAVLSFIAAASRRGELHVQVIQGEGFTPKVELRRAITREIFRLVRGGGSATAENRYCGVRGRDTKIKPGDIEASRDELAKLLSARDSKALVELHTAIIARWEQISVVCEYGCSTSHSHYSFTTKA